MPAIAQPWKPADWLLVDWLLGHAEVDGEVVDGEVVDGEVVDGEVNDVAVLDVDVDDDEMEQDTATTEGWLDPRLDWPTVMVPRSHRCHYCTEWIPRQDARWFWQRVVTNQCDATSDASDTTTNDSADYHPTDHHDHDHDHYHYHPHGYTATLYPARMLCSAGPWIEDLHHATNRLHQLLRAHLNLHHLHHQVDPNTDPDTTTTTTHPLLEQLRAHVERATHGTRQLPASVWSPMVSSLRGVASMSSSMGSSSHGVSSMMTPRLSSSRDEPMTVTAYRSVSPDGGVLTLHFFAAAVVAAPTAPAPSSSNHHSASTSATTTTTTSSLAPPPDHLHPDPHPYPYDQEDYTHLCLHALTSSKVKRLQRADGRWWWSPPLDRGTLTIAPGSDSAHTIDESSSDHFTTTTTTTDDNNHLNPTHTGNSRRTPLASLLRPRLRRLQFDSCCLRARELRLVAKLLPRCCPHLSAFSYDRSTVYEILDDDDDEDEDDEEVEEEEEEEEYDDEDDHNSDLRISRPPGNAHLQATHLLFDMVLGQRHHQATTIHHVQLLGLYWEYTPEIMEKLHRLVRKPGLRSLSLSFPATRHAVTFVEALLGWMLFVDADAAGRGGVSNGHSVPPPLAAPTAAAAMAPPPIPSRLPPPPPPPPPPSQLESLALMESRLDDRTVPLFIAVLRTHPQLHRLVLTGNRFSEDGLVHLVESALELAFMAPRCRRSHGPHLELYLTWDRSDGRGSSMGVSGGTGGREGWGRHRHHHQPPYHDPYYRTRRRILAVAQRLGLAWQQLGARSRPVEGPGLRMGPGSRRARLEPGRRANLERIRFSEQSAEVGWRAILELQMEEQGAAGAAHHHGDDEYAGFDER